MKNVIMDKSVLESWLKAGFMENGKLHNTTEGTPQGGIASPVLANIALDGLEKEILAIKSKGSKINYVRYADDWIVTASSKEILEEKVLPIVTKFLAKRGLELSPEKTKITHINEGFDFLGFNIRKYRTKLLIKPGKKSVTAFLETVQEILDSMKQCKVKDLIRRLNPVIQGWANHNKHVVSKKIFSRVDHIIFHKIWRWAKRRHPNKSKLWIKTKYYKRFGNRDWILFSRESKEKSEQKEFLTLINAGDTPIVRHIKIKAKATPYDTAYTEYFNKRNIRKRMMRSRTARHRS